MEFPEASKSLQAWQELRPEAWQLRLRKDLLRPSRTRSHLRRSEWDFGNSSSLLRTPAITRKRSRPTSSSTQMGVSGARAVFQAMPWAFILLNPTLAIAKNFRSRQPRTASHVEITGLLRLAMTCRVTLLVLQQTCLLPCSRDVAKTVSFSGALRCWFLLIDEAVYKVQPQCCPAKPALGQQTMSCMCSGCAFEGKRSSLRIRFKFVV